MRGRPNPPAGVLAVSPVFSIDGAAATFTHHLLIPGIDLATVSQIETWLNVFLPYLQDLTTAVTHAGCVMERVDLQRFGALPVALKYPVPPNHGAWTGGELATGASVVSWLTADSGRHKNGQTYFPGFPDAWTDDHVNVNDTGRGNLQAACVSYLGDLSLVPGVSGGVTSMGVVRTSSHGAPLPLATVSPVIGANASWTLGTIDRRRTTRFPS